MKIYDITKELFSTKSYPGDITPTSTPINSMEEGEVFNRTLLTMSTHNSTHVDAPRHFYADGRTVEQVDLSKCIGECTLISHEGLFTEKEVETLAVISKRKLLIKGNITITNDAAKALVSHGFEFIGVEGITVGPEKAPMQVHLTLLHPDAELVIAENLDLSDVPVGEYFLFCPPLKLGGMDGSPTRAVLIKF